jgi:CHAT domain-containing protein/pimeloyl-ACP methyl ester carboxylesterase
LRKPWVSTQRNLEPSIVNARHTSKHQEHFMATSTQAITFAIPGQPQAAEDAAAPSHGTLKASVRVGAQRGSGDDVVRVTAVPGEDVVVLTIANGPTLVLHPEDARDLLRAQAGSGTRSAVAASASDEVVVAPQLGWPGLESTASRGRARGWLGQAVLSAFDVVTGLFKDQAASLASAAITKQVDGAVEAGVYELSADSLPEFLKGSGRKRDAVPAATDGGPLLVLMHGTFVDTVSTFGKLWKLHPQTVRELFQHYASSVYALDHPTMGQSPIANALTLVRALPAGARLHLLTHSRGGLVAEVLARACGGGLLTPEEEALFADPKYKEHLRDLQALTREAKAKGLKVERLVRVACPARGTTLASKRLDAYLSVLRWGLQLAGVPVAPHLVDFLHEVALRRTDPAELPGLEAMMPESAVVAWLNRGEDDLPGELRVVAGDLQGDAIGSWVKTLLSDAFYWTDNDLVVQTRSMYGGAPRTADAAGAGASFLLDRGGKVTHFNYFSNDCTVRAIASALLDAAPGDFKAIGPLSWAGQDSGGTRAARAVARSRGGPRANPADRPAVFVLPGILGSNLKLDGKRIWLGFRFVNGLKRLAWDPATAGRVEPDGPIGSTYDDLIERLADSHEVIPFAYDWRRPIEDEARRLAQAVDSALLARGATGQPVRLIAHSMGGLVARAMQLEAPDTWKRLMAHDGARLLMLGTPNAGSWAPMQTLSGDDTFGNALVAFGSLFDNGGARKMMAAMPGFIQLQAGLLDPALGLDKASVWQKLADDDLARLRDRSFWHTWDEASPQRSIYEWGAPPQAVLDQAVALRRRLDAQVTALGSDAKKVLLVIGHAAFTPAGYVIDNDGLSYLDAPDDGDGRVTRASALLPGVRTWKVNAEHGKLPDVPSAFAAYIELLTTGQTSQLEAFEPKALGARSAAGTSTGTGTAIGDAQTPGVALVRSRPSRGLMASTPPSSQADVLGLGREGLSDGEPAAGQTSALSVAVLNADLKFVPQPLLIGHYRAMRLTGAECVIDRLVGNAMSRALNAGLYPDATGSHQIFGNHRNNPENPLEMARPSAAIVVGLGEEGKLRVVDLVYTVRQAVLAYAQRLSDVEGDAPAQFEMAATLIGSGGANITPGVAARAIAQGALEANQKLQGSGWPQLSQLTLVELYLERAGDAWRALQLQEIAAPKQLKLVGKVQFGPGALRRSLDSSYRGATYDFISALHVPGGNPAIPCIAYKLDTKRARTEVRAQHAQGTLLRELVAKASNDANTDPDIGRTLFNLLIPVEVEPFLGGTSEMVIELEPQTAGIPWELLDTNPDAHSDDKRPWAIRSKLIRKLQLEEYRAQLVDASPEDNVLVIGEPKCNPKLYPPLPGARREAVAVARQLKAQGSGIADGKVIELVDQNDAQTIINALFKRPYRVVHVAGHGEYGENGGVVLSGDNTYLGANEVNAMRTVPELVFLNCCHLAGRDVADTLKSYDRAKFAANIAEALIKVGVRCVIAAGWAVEDDAAEQFATSFYASLLGGARFIEAVGVARTAAWNVNRRGNTWAAYQCYGDPEWSWRREGADAQRPAPPPGDEFAGVASPVSLALALETLAIQSQYSSVKPERQLDKLRYLESEFARLWGAMGAVAEGFGLAYAQANAVDKAIEWYRTAVDAEDGSASFKAAEQLGNQLVRRGERQLDAAAARKDIQEGIAQLARLAAVKPTLERESLLGSAYKRLTMVEWRAGRSGDAKKALDKAALHYAEAEAIADKQRADNLYYPAKNAISAQVRAAFLNERLPEFAEGRMKAAADSLAKAATDKPDFWSVAGQTELQMLAALAKGQLASAEAELIAALRLLKARVPSVQMWDSVYNEAQFTLEPYMAMLDTAKKSTVEKGMVEKQAAQRLLESLKALATA